MAEDRYLYSSGVSAPADRALTVAPHDVNELPRIGKALLVVSGGTVVLRGAGDDHDETFPNVPEYALLPIRARFIRATGTTATHIKVLD